MTDDTYDLIAIGGGLAGMVAGVRAAELGLRVAVLEKGAGVRYPCNTRWSGGIVHIGYTDPKDADEVLRAAIARQTGGFTDPALAGTLVRDTGRAIDWLRAQGGRFMKSGAAAWQNWMMAPPRRLIAGPDWEGRGPDVMLRLLAARLHAHGGTLALETPARSLRMDDGRCTGVETDGRVLVARAVVLADGGFQGDLDALAEHIAPLPRQVKQRGTATGAGDGLRMARAAGAAISPLDRFYGHLLHRDSMTNDRVWPYPELDGIASAGIVVDTAGTRIVDEGMGGIFMANAIARSAAPLTATAVFDTAIWEGPGRSARIPANPELARAGGTIHRAGTLDELARLAGLDPGGLIRTIAAYNDALASGGLDALSPRRSADRYLPMPIAAAPFLAIPLCAGITYTMGGIRIDGDARVLRAGGDARDTRAAADTHVARDGGGTIPGLYAAGSTTGGIEGGPRAGYIGGLAKAAVFGLRAAEHAAGLIGETIR